ncbi:hypothetical protein C474_10796 [Halogeometricum pallidum JCM 14848]|uniref:Uncharacterized protein n=1 Tax=Halogeometricum pallidum JCM 14848 TaxID=1227487 RepID=M0D9W3_HALPD|nr:hypothetical protein [Halogeometricum pallidum]ELZ30944.1 hypothetical protein C474_10796 [Halogeometricum pallidum JCM 14848]
MSGRTGRRTETETEPTARRHVAHPTRPGGVLAVLAAVLVVAAVTGSGAADSAGAGPLAGVPLVGLGLSLLGVAGLVAAAAVRRRGHAVVGGLLLLAGAGGVVAAVAATATGAEALSERLVTGAGVAGVALVGAGVAPLRSNRAGGLVTVGAAVLTVSVVLAGLLTETGATPLLVAMVAAVVAWDAGERAVSLGEQVGVAARTWPVEVGRTAATAGYGVVVVAATLGVRGMGVTDVPLVGLLLLLCAAVALLVALSN